MEEMKQSMIKLGLLGERLTHSLSPKIHEQLFKQMKIQGEYKLYEVKEEALPILLDNLKKEQLLGLNVTVPYKEKIMQYLDIVGKEAQEIGAVNTILIQDGRTYGANTDYIGVQQMFIRNHISIEGKKITILGSGGAAKAVVYACIKGGAESICVVGRNTEQLHLFIERFPQIKICDYESIQRGQIIINTTPVGMYPHVGVSVVGTEVLTRFSIAIDIVYRPLETRFLQLAKESGATTITGLSMLVDQAIGSEEIWLKRKLDYRMGDDIIALCRSNNV